MTMNEKTPVDPVKPDGLHVIWHWAILSILMTILIGGAALLA